MSHELLAPAGSLKIFKAVIRAGADAVYLGGEKYGARAFAHNFSQEELFEALDLAHANGRKVHLTVNTLLKNRETERELYDYIEPYYRRGLDAIIIQDFGVFTFLRENFPGLELHTSTQMSVANPYGASFLKAQGADRLVLARELSLEEIRAIYDATGMDIECFIHGALCYCYSGQCLMSSILGGRSGNRGRCAQPCRLAYDVLDQKDHRYHADEKYPLSPKDLCGLEVLPSLCESGVYSFKIEGRMKQLEYAAGVTSVYRRYLDAYEADPQNYRIDPADYAFLMKLGNRNGFTKGYYEMRNGRSMMTLTESAHNSGNAEAFEIPEHKRTYPVTGTVVLYPDSPAALYLQYEDVNVEVAGDVVQHAQKRPLLEADVREKMEKTGDTAFTFEHLEVSMAEDCFMPVKQLNELRRQAFGKLTEQVFGPTERNLPDSGMLLLRNLAENRKNTQEDLDSEGAGLCKKPSWNVMVSTEEQLRAACQNKTVPMISLNHIGAEHTGGAEFASTAEYAAFLAACADQIHQVGKKAGFCFPHVFRANTASWFEDPELLSVLAVFDHFYVRSYDSLGYALQIPGICTDRITADHSLYVYSQEAAAAFSMAGVKHYTASLELNGKELKHMPNASAEMLVYGYIPLMVSAQCVYKNYDRCLKGIQDRKELKLKDRYQKEFFVERNCRDCYNVIYNSQPLSLFHHAAQIQSLGMETLRISFVEESGKQAAQVLNQFEEAFLQGKIPDAPAGKDSYTNGHFRRGID